MNDEQKQKLITEMSGLLQRPLTDESSLDGEEQPWDSLCVVYTQSFIDDITGRMVDGAALAKCQTVAQVLALAAVDPLES